MYDIFNLFATFPSLIFVALIRLCWFSQLKQQLSSCSIWKFHWLLPFNPQLLQHHQCQNFYILYIWKTSTWNTVGLHQIRRHWADTGTLWTYQCHCSCPTTCKLYFFSTIDDTKQIEMPLLSYVIIFFCQNEKHPSLTRKQASSNTVQTLSTLFS